MLTVINLTKRFADHTILNNISFETIPGNVLTIMGCSGGGKTTLLRCICGLDQPDTGTLLLDGQPVRTLPAGAIGLVPQGYHLFEHFTVLENITYALCTVSQISKTVANNTALKLLTQLNIQDKAHIYPVKLSGGQKQRVALARALAMKPRILLFDEPTSALDLEMTAEVARLIRSIAQESILIIIATHDLNLAEVASDEILLLDKGYIVEKASANNFLKNPQAVRTQQFLNSIRPTYI